MPGCIQLRTQSKTYVSLYCDMMWYDRIDWHHTVHRLRPCVKYIAVLFCFLLYYVPVKQLSIRCLKTYSFAIDTSISSCIFHLFILFLPLSSPVNASHDRSSRSYNVMRCNAMQISMVRSSDPPSLICSSWRMKKSYQSLWLSRWRNTPPPPLPHPYGSHSSVYMSCVLLLKTLYFHMQSYNPTISYRKRQSIFKSLYLVYIVPAR